MIIVTPSESSEYSTNQSLSNRMWQNQASWLLIGWQEIGEDFSTIQQNNYRICMKCQIFGIKIIFEAIWIFKLKTSSLRIGALLNSGLNFLRSQILSIWLVMWCKWILLRIQSNVFRNLWFELALWNFHAPLLRWPRFEKPYCAIISCYFCLRPLT